MKNECIISGVLVIFCAIPFLWWIIKIVRGRFDLQEDFVLLFVALLGVLYSFIFGLCFYRDISWFLSPPVISSRIPVVTRENDTLYEFHDSTRYCKGHIEKDEISTKFTITKEDAKAVLYGTDTCEICGLPLREHWKSQEVGSVDVYIDMPSW